MNKIDINIGNENREMLKEKFPHGFRVIGGRTSGYGCSAFIRNRFFPDKYSLFDPDDDLDLTYADKNNSEFKLLAEYPVDNANLLGQNPNFKLENVVAFVDRTPKTNATGFVLRDKQVNHVALIVNEPEIGLALESKLDGGDSPRIVNYNLDDLLQYEREAGKVTHLQIFEAVKK